LDQIPNRREIIDRKALSLALAELKDSGGAGLRGGALALLKDALSQGRDCVRKRFEDGTSALVTMQSNSYLVDQLLRVLHDFTIERAYSRSNPSTSEHLSLVAVGGYGRGEMAPFSDVDLLFLQPYKQTAWGEQVVEYMLYMLFDLGLKVGHSVRSVDECVRLSLDDMTIRTSLLEARWIWGDQELYADFRAKFAKKVVAKTGPEFVEAKLKERDERHQRLGDSRYLVEPNLKEGKGGLRDLHTLMWIAKYLYHTDSLTPLVEQGVLTPGEYRRFVHARGFLSGVRCHLHYLTNRGEERVTFDMQPELARRMGYAEGEPGRREVERFMRDYYLVAKDVGDLTRVFCAALEEKHKKQRPFAMLRLPRRRKEIDGFLVDGGRLSVDSDAIFKRQPVKLLRLFHLAQEQKLDIHPNALRLVRANLPLIDRALRADAEANRLFLEMLTSRLDPETTLRRLNESGVFGRFVPDFGRVVARTQHDMYHVYTVDEHTIRAIGILSQIEHGKLAEEHPLANTIVHQVLSRRVLYLSVLLHDIAKGRGGDHSVLGEGVARRMGPKLGFTAAETDTVAWLVRWHLLMSATAFKRDLSDPKTVADFINQVQSPERLRLLLVLTVVDIRAVGPTVWNGWKGQLLRELYYRAEEVMTGGLAGLKRDERVAQARDKVAAALNDWPAADIKALEKRHFDSYWLSHDTETAARHARFIRDADRSGRALSMETRSDRFRSVTEIVLYTADHPGLFARIAGAIAMCGGNIVDAKIYTTTDGKALDTFIFQDTEGGAFDRPDRLARLSAAIQGALSGEVRLKGAIATDKPGVPARAKVFRVEPVVLIDNGASHRATVIEVNGRDRPGLLYDVTKALFELSLSIGSARVATYGERAVDVFYITDLTGMKVTDKGRLAAIEKRLIQALLPPEEREAAAPPKTRAPRADTVGAAE
jgi:[protein-PII] uridylyltransferase